MRDCINCGKYINKEHCMEDITFCEKSLEEHDNQLKEKVIESAYYVIKPFMELEEWVKEVNRQMELREQTNDNK